MDYERVYRQFIADRREKCGLVKRTRGRELHHIRPRCLGGDNTPENLISLSREDHLFAHLLLARIHGGKLVFALRQMCGTPRYQGRFSRRRYDWAQREHARLNSEMFKGRKHTPAQRAALARTNALGLNRHDQWRKSLEKTWEANRGRPAHPKALEAISRKGADRSDAQKRRDQHACATARSRITEESIKKMAATKRGVPWSQARRDAQAARTTRSRAPLN